MILNKHYNDFEEYAEAAIEWNIHLRQLDSGHFTGSLIQIPTKHVLLTSVHFGRRLYIKGETPKDCYNFSIPLNPNLDTFWYGQNFILSSIGVGPSENYIDGINQAGLATIEVSISKSYLNKILNRRESSEIDKIIPPESVIECDARQLLIFQKKLHDNINLLKTTPNLISNKSAINDLVNTIPSELLKILNFSKVKIPPFSLRKRKRAINRAIDYMYSHYYQYPNIGEICKISEVSERTLELAFKERYGVSPLAFLNAIRLNTVYSILKKSVPEETKIGQIANKNGFWHMGKFAADYKKQFGELPSETLKKKPKMY